VVTTKLLFIEQPKTDNWARHCPITFRPDSVIVVNKSGAFKGRPPGEVRRQKDEEERGDEGREARRKEHAESSQ